MISSIRNAKETSIISTRQRLKRKIKIRAIHQKIEYYVHEQRKLSTCVKK